MKSILKYFFRTKIIQKDENANLKAMHIINRVAIVIGLIGLAIVISKNI